MDIFKDRKHAGRLLSDALKDFKEEDPIILALPRGGVILGDIIAEDLKAKLSLVIAQKIGHPYKPEYAIAAITSDGTLVGNEQELLSVPPSWLLEAQRTKQTEAKRRELLYLRGGKSPSIKDRCIILVDDGLATGLTMECAIMQVKKEKPKKIIVAVPVSAKISAEKIKKEVDFFISLMTPFDLGSIGQFYENFEQVSDDEVLQIMRKY